MLSAVGDRSPSSALEAVGFQPAGETPAVRNLLVTSLELLAYTVMAKDTELLLSR